MIFLEKINDLANRLQEKIKSCLFIEEELEMKPTTNNTEIIFDEIDNDIKDSHLISDTVYKYQSKFAELKARIDMIGDEMLNAI